MLRRILRFPFSITTNLELQNMSQIQDPNQSSYMPYYAINLKLAKAQTIEDVLKAIDQIDSSLLEDSHYSFAFKIISQNLIKTDLDQQKQYCKKLFIDPRFQAIKLQIVQKIEQLNPQEICDFSILLNRIKNNCGVKFITQQNKHALKRRVQELVMENKFNIDQLVLLYLNLKVMKEISFILEDKLIQTLKRDTSKNIIHATGIIQAMHEGTFNKELLEIVLRKCQILDLSQQSVNSLINLAIQLFKLNAMHNFGLSLFVLRQVEFIIAKKIKEFSSEDIHFLLKEIKEVVGLTQQLVSDYANLLKLVCNKAVSEGLLNSKINLDLLIEVLHTLQVLQENKIFIYNQQQIFQLIQLIFRDVNDMSLTQLKKLAFSLKQLLPKVKEQYLQNMIYVFKKEDKEELLLSVDSLQALTHIITNETTNQQL